MSARNIKTVDPFPVQLAATDKTVEIIAGSQITNHDAHTLADHLAVCEDGKLHAVLVTKNFIAVGPVKLCEEVLAIGLDVMLLLADGIFLHKTLGNPAADATGCRVDESRHFYSLLQYK